MRLGWRLEAVGPQPCADEASLLGLLEGLPDAPFVFATTAHVPPSPATDAAAPVLVAAAAAAPSEPPPSRPAAATPAHAAVMPAAATPAAAPPVVETAARAKLPPAAGGGAKSTAVREAEALSSLLAGLVSGDASTNGALALAYQTEAVDPAATTEAVATEAVATDGGHPRVGDYPTVGDPLKQPVADFLTGAGLLPAVALAVAGFVRGEFEAGCAEDLAVLDEVTTLAKSCIDIALHVCVRYTPVAIVPLPSPLSSPRCAPRAL